MRRTILDADGHPIYTDEPTGELAAEIDRLAASMKRDMEAALCDGGGEAARLRRFREAFGLPQEPVAGLDAWMAS